MIAACIAALLYATGVIEILKVFLKVYPTVTSDVSKSVAGVKQEAAAFEDVSDPISKSYNDSLSE